MIGLMTGFLVGGALSAFSGLLMTIAVEYSYREPWERIMEVARLIVILVVIVAGGVTGCYVERNVSCQYLEMYIAEKQTIEASLENDMISGFERVELVKQAAEANKELAGVQYDCKQWYGFNKDKRIVDLLPVNLAERSRNEGS